MSPGRQLQQQELTQQSAGNGHENVDGATPRSLLSRPCARRKAVRTGNGFIRRVAGRLAARNVAGPVGGTVPNTANGLQNGRWREVLGEEQNEKKRKKEKEKEEKKKKKKL